MPIGLDIALVHRPGPEREHLEKLLSSRSLVACDEPAGLATLGRSRLVIIESTHVVLGRAQVPPTVPMIALAPDADAADAALASGVDEIVLWPGSRRALERRVSAFLDGRLGPGRIVLDPRRVTSLVHAVRNPLNVITLYAELLKLEATGEDARGSIGRLVRAAKRVDALVGELETLLYLEGGEARAQVQPVELGELVEIVLGELTYDIEDKPLTVRTHLAPEGTLATADPGLARRALHAVFGRVAKLSLGHAEIDVRTESNPPTVTIEAPIEPIRPEQQPAFQQPATELDAREALGGVGVGLSFAHAALAAMGGALEHDATSEGRAITRLRFPGTDLAQR